ncbi:ABC transporter ATP-binding protein [Actinomadura sp. 1N219]|uniref:ABC transporter ATP-binding protein n=1 Tax=Actinomadura sp. 1N219 TaxID=3375152 RepID=UPI00379B6584
MTATIRLENVTKSFDGVTAVDDLSLELGGPEIQGVIGPNGAGKTTLFRLLSGFVRADSGRVSLDGRRIDRLPAYRRARLGIVRTFQEQEVFPDLTVGEVLTTAALARSGLPAARRRAAGAADDLQLRWDATPAELTPAEIRRLELGRAEVAEPRILLLDEIMAGLTAAEADLMLERIAELHRRGVAIILVEHVVDIVMRACAQIHVLVGGRLLTSGPPGAIVDDDRVIAAYLGRRGGGPR